MSTNRAAANTRLASIAHALGCPVEELVRGAKEPLAVNGASELLSLWVEMDDDADREKLLVFARQIVAER